MNIVEVLNQKPSRIRRKCWDLFQYITVPLSTNIGFIDEEGDEWSPKHFHLVADDWEVVEEKLVITKDMLISACSHLSITSGVLAEIWSLLQKEKKK